MLFSQTCCGHSLQTPTLDKEPLHSKKNLCQCHFFYHKSHMEGLRSYPSLHIVRSSTNHLSHGLALNQKKQVWVTMLAFILMCLNKLREREGLSIFFCLHTIVLFVRVTPAFIFVHSDSACVDSDCKTHVHSILKTVNFFQCMSAEKFPQKDRKVQREYM
jgi:hypothetical protein